MSYEYSYGLPFSLKLKETLDDLHERIVENKASLIILDGPIGSGKTTLAVHLADYFNSKMDLPKIDLKNPTQYSFGGEDFLEKLRLCYENKLPVCIYDEAGDFTSRGALTKFNRILNRCFETFRAFKILVILCLPAFYSLDSSLLDKGISRLLIHCSERDSTGNFLVYGLYRQFYLRENMRKAICKPQCYGIVKPNFRGHFLDLSEQRRNELDRLSTRNKIISLRQSEISAAGLISYKDIAKALGRSVAWAKGSIGKLKIKAVRRIGRQLFYDDSCINILQDYKDKMIARQQHREE